MTILYFLVGLVASIIGAIAGLGGGIIIKPVLDFLGHYDVTTIGVLSSSTVLSMAIVSLINAFRSGSKVKLKIGITLAVGSIVGGLIGNFIFEILIDSMKNKDFVTVIQAGILAILMTSIFILDHKRKNMRTANLENIFLIFMAGIGLGGIASFLGIGGGPLNIPILMLAFSMTAKEAALNSIFIIFFSQVSSLLLTATTTGFSPFNLEMLWVMIVGGALGGWIGRMISRKMDDAHVVKLFHILLLVVLILNIYNMINYLI
ncbi:sulfite exporter TauE/SafE family protein [Bacillus niameyensis]|uniref:sulfite exporter TauE/SafE family protein n=1 Tax=Bacillus niameyensis TaxID=1522308 RepID=UPI000783B9A1|nr:sulfite exporter TauE/SafE family protein [Bacillus niameyensis]